MVPAMTDRADDDGLDLDLPELDLPEATRPNGAGSDDGSKEPDGADAAGRGVEQLGLQDPAPFELSEVPDDQVADPFDDANAHDLPLEIELSTTDEQPTAIGDDHIGIGGEDVTEHGNELALTSVDAGSFVDSGGRAEEGLTREGDDELGIDPIPREIDDGGLEGLQDPSESELENEFPPLDGDDDDDDAAELDVGIDISTPRPEGA
jgi:hypothetical protein